MKCHWIVRCVFGVVIAVVVTSGSAMAQQTGGATGGVGGTQTGTGTTTGANIDSGGGGADLNGDTENTASAKAIDSALNSMTSDKVTNLRASGVGRVGVVNSFGTGNLNANGQIPTNSATSGAGPTGAGVRFRNAQGQSRYGTTTSTSTRTTGATGGTGRTATGLGGAGGAQGLNNMFGGTGGLGAQGSTTSARIPLIMGEGLRVPAATAKSANLVSSQIRSLPLLAQSPQVQVQTEGRVVTLSGSVASQKEADQLVRTVKMRSGVGSVVNRIVVREQGSPSDRPQ